MPIQRTATLPPDRKSAFELLYSERMLGDHETLSGKGSTLMATRNLRKSLSHLIVNHMFTSILDVGCGDFNWMSTVDLSAIQYTGIDIVPAIIELNKPFTKPNIAFAQMDITESVPSKSDLVLCREIFPYLSHQDMVSAFNNIKKSGARYIAISGDYPEYMKEKKQHYYDEKLNSNSSSGYWHAVNMRRHPFYFPTPQFSIQENQPGVRLDIWALDDLPYIDYADIKNPQLHNPTRPEDFMAYPFFRELCALPFVQKIALFGSRAIDKNRPDSDIDLMFYCDPNTTREQWLQVCEIIRKTNIRFSIDCLRYADTLRSIMDKWPPDFRTLYERR